MKWILTLLLVCGLAPRAQAQPYCDSNSFYASVGHSNYAYPMWATGRALTADSVSHGLPPNWYYQTCYYQGHWQDEVWFYSSATSLSCQTFAGSTGGLIGTTCKAISANAQEAGEGSNAYGQLTLNGYGCKNVGSKVWEIDRYGQFFLRANFTYDDNITVCGQDPPPDPSYEECEYHWNEEMQTWELYWCPSPIILPIADQKSLKRQDYKLTDQIHGVQFDLNADGIEELTAWTHQNSHLAFLALDRNGNGKIDNGSELFGNHTFTGVGNGFAALNREAGYVGLIREGVPLYEKLLLWEDENHNGISEAWELHKLSDHYVGVDGGYEPDAFVDKYGNAFRFRGTAALREPGKSKHYPKEPGEDSSLLIPIWDVFFLSR